MKSIIQFTKDTLPKVITTCIKPEKPHPNSCCGTGCGDICIWMPYYKALVEYEECIKLTLQSKNKDVDKDK